MDTVTVHYWPTESQGCSIQPLSFILTITLILSSCTTLMLCTSVLTDHWENMEWDFQEALSILRTQNKSSKWLNNVKTEWLVNGTILQITINSKKSSPVNNGDALLVLATANQFNSNNYDMHSLFYQTKETATVILAPMYGGIWTLCISLTDDQLLQLYQETNKKTGSILSKCENFLVEETSTEYEYYKPDWNHRMQNMSISCALVCVIIVITASLIGLFSIVHHQISAMLITAVMFFLTATFGLFTLGIMHNKRHSRKTLSRNCNQSLELIDGMINLSGNMCQTIYFWEKLLTARIYSLGWSVNLGWIAVILCILTSFLWIFLSKIMRQSPFNNSLNH